MPEPIWTHVPTFEWSELEGKHGTLTALKCVSGGRVLGFRSDDGHIYIIDVKVSEDDDVRLREDEGVGEG